MTMLAAPPASRQYTPEDLLTMDGLVELVDGQLVEKHMSFMSGETAVIISSLLQPFIRANNLGKLVSETSFRSFPSDPQQVRRPDLAFISTARLSRVPDEGHVPIAPDLAIEIVSPGDSVYDLDDKLIDYRSAGIPLVWVFNPHVRMVRVHRLNRQIEELAESDQLTGEDILPGFATKVGDLFPVPTPKQS